MYTYLHQPPSKANMGMGHKKRFILVNLINSNYTTIELGYCVHRSVSISTYTCIDSLNCSTLPHYTNEFVISTLWWKDRTST